MRMSELHAAKQVADRFTDADGYTGPRMKGQRIGTLWLNMTHGEADVTLSPLFDELDDVHKLDALQDVIGLLQREQLVIHRRCYPKKGEK